MKTLAIIFTVVLAAIQLNAQSFIDTYIHIIPDYGGGTGELMILDCTNPNGTITKTITFDGNLLPLGQATGITSGVKILHYTASDGSNTYEFEASIDFSSANPSITYSITPAVEPMSVIQTHKSSSPNCDGEINLITSGGNLPAHFNWFQNGNPMFSTPGQTSKTGLCAGSYGYTFGDASTLCSGSGTMFNVTIDEVSCIVMVDAMSCFGVCDGSAEVFPTGTNPGGMVSSVIMNLTGDQDATNLYNQCSGMITGMVTDYTGAIAQCQNVIGEPDLINFDLTVGNATGNGLDNGYATVDVTAGAGSYTYDWSGPNSYTNTGDSIGDLVPGNYSVDITYNSGNCDTTVTFGITEPSGLIITINNTTAQTLSPANGAVDFTISGGVQPYDTILDNGQTQVHGGPFNELAFGTYTLKVVDYNGNMDDTTFTIDSYLSLQENQNLSGLKIYPNPASESITIKGDDLKSAIIYDINGRVVIDQSISEQAIINISNLDSGIYTVKIQAKDKEYIEKLIVQ